MVYKVGFGTANNKVPAFPEIIFFSNIVFKFYEENSDHRYNYIINYYFEDLDYVINQFSMTSFTSLISYYSFIITDKNIIYFDNFWNND